MKVYLNIYDLSKANYYIHSIGFGMYHTGIQVGSTEYHYGGHEGSSTGVYSTEPQQQISNAIFREAIYLGACTLSYSQVNNALDELKREFVGNSYDILSCNCNHFSNAVSKKLLGKPIPSYINRLASLGNVFRCCLPSSLVQGPGSDPTRQDNNSNSKGKASNSESQTFKSFKGSGVSIGGGKASSKKGNNDRQGFTYLQQQDLEN